jgi:hypothetical protein
LGWGCGSTRRMNCICVVCAALAKSHNLPIWNLPRASGKFVRHAAGRIVDRAGVLAHWPKTAPGSALMSNAAANSARV